LKEQYFDIVRDRPYSKEALHMRVILYVGGGGGMWEKKNLVNNA
jgi:hypothetical protein